MLWAPVSSPCASRRNCRPNAPSVTYDLEYGTDTLEIHTDAIFQGCKVLIVDDLLATGGTAKAATQLVEELGGIVVGRRHLWSS